jgi:hypothetical protein
MNIEDMESFPQIFSDEFFEDFISKIHQAALLLVESIFISPFMLIKHCYDEQDDTVDFHHMMSESGFSNDEKNEVFEVFENWLIQHDINVATEAIRHKVFNENYAVMTTVVKMDVQLSVNETQMTFDAKVLTAFESLEAMQEEFGYEIESFDNCYLIPKEFCFNVLEKLYVSCIHQFGDDSED